MILKSTLPMRIFAGLMIGMLSLALNQAAFAEETPSPPVTDKPDMAWFTDARLGIFIHWGIYSEGKGSESWAFHEGQMPRDEYFAQASTFTASKFDPGHWAEVFAAAGARYAVLTSKHHDGFALWDTAQSRWNAKDSSPAGRDLVGPYCDAMRAHGLKVGLYFSHLDWSHPDYATVLKDGPMTAKERANKYSYPQGPQDPVAWQRFLAFHRAQLSEITHRYHPDLLWFDGDWERSASQWKMAELRKQLKEWDPGVILNSRMVGYGDYATPEQALPVIGAPGPWELCMTINDSWGYQAQDHNFKSVRQIVRILTECASQGGNLLLDVGPRNDGTITPEEEAILRSLGTWTHKNAECLYGTTRGIPKDYYYGPSMLSKDRSVLYLVCYDRPVDGIYVKGIKNAVQRVSVLGGPDLVSHRFMRALWANQPGVLVIDVPESSIDPDATIVRIQLEGPLSLTDSK
jgi:alpha-L-fucosidase